MSWGGSSCLWCCLSRRKLLGLCKLGMHGSHLCEVDEADEIAHDPWNNRVAEKADMVSRLSISPLAAVSLLSVWTFTSRLSDHFQIWDASALMRKNVS